MKKKMIYVCLFSSLLLVSCGKNEKATINEDKETKTSQVKQNSKKEDSIKKENTGEIKPILNQPLENISGNVLTILDWTVIPPNTASNEENRPNLVIYYSLEKQGSEKLNLPSQFYDIFGFNQGENDLTVSDYSSLNSISSAFRTRNVSNSDNSGLTTVYAKQGIYLLDDQTPVTIKSKHPEKGYEEVLDITDKEHLLQEETSSLETGGKPAASEILDIYASQEVGNTIRSSLSVKEENADGSVDISIETANGYIHSYFEGDSLIFEEKSFEKDKVITKTRYNYKTKEVKKDF